MMPPKFAITIKASYSDLSHYMKVLVVHESIDGFLKALFVIDFKTGKMKRDLSIMNCPLKLSTRKFQRYFSYLNFIL